MPLRHEIARLDRDRARATRRWPTSACPTRRPTLLVTGGSLGAQRLNATFAERVEALRRAGVQVLHVSGLGKEFDPGPQPSGAPYVVVPYVDRMDLAYAAADLVVARAGANTVCELTAVGLPAVYVPLPIGNGEQRVNAADVVAAGGGVLVDDGESRRRGWTPCCSLCSATRSGWRPWPRPPQASASARPTSGWPTWSAPQRTDEGSPGEHAQHALRLQRRRPGGDDPRTGALHRHRWRRDVRCRPRDAGPWHPRHRVGRQGLPGPAGPRGGGRRRPRRPRRRPRRRRGHRGHLLGDPRVQRRARRRPRPRAAGAAPQPGPGLPDAGPTPGRRGRGQRQDHDDVDAHRRAAGLRRRPVLRRGRRAGQARHQRPPRHRRGLRGRGGRE